MDRKVLIGVIITSLVAISIPIATYLFEDDLENYLGYHKQPSCEHLETGYYEICKKCGKNLGEKESEY